MYDLYECKCGATLEIESGKNGYHSVECFECNYTNGNNSVYDLEEDMKNDGCKPINL